MNELTAYGIIVYIPGPGTPEEDEAHFDGWYSDLSMAHEVFKVFVKKYPNGLVHLVRRLESEWRAKTK